ncbi:hypothetical protein PAHAL_2G054500 [Panicum hallii]|uniref:RRM domain-containing protein n=1 Tax=Panicum hallii TaxID=206008 RepID=A0A2S3GW45_9POAL|nr:RNA-binding protein 42-like [Panicum hallii]PAN09860.1 hypothetical protein PAHAL_2G054500 [Panicum hallii]
MQRSPEDVVAPPAPAPPLDDEGELRRAEANGFQLFLGNLGAEVDEAFLAGVFSRFASYVPGSARVRREPDGTTRCYGYVTFSERRDAAAAVAELDGGLVWNGRVRLSCCRLRGAEARRLPAAQLRERCEVRRRLIQERVRRLEEEKRRVALSSWSMAVSSMR